jgi:hypothetical protein
MGEEKGILEEWKKKKTLIRFRGFFEGSASRVASVQMKDDQVLF